MLPDRDAVDLVQPLGRCRQVMFQAGAGGSLRSGVTKNPVKLTRSVQSMVTNVTVGGAPVYVWPGGGITSSSCTRKTRLTGRATAGRSC